MLWFAGLLLGPLTCPFTPVASQSVWELQYMTKDIKSTLLLYFKHSPLPGNQSFSLSIKKLPSRKVQRKKKNRKEATAVSNERKGAGGYNPSSSQWPIAAVILPLAWVGQETPENATSGNSKSLHLCSGCPHICFMASPPNLPQYTCQNSYSQEAQEVSTVFEAPFPLSMILHVCKLTRSSFFS